MQHMDFPLDVKDVGEDGMIEGFASTYGNVDFGGDVVLPGAFTKALKSLKSLPMLLFHDQRRPIGVWNEFEDGPKGLKMRGRISTGTAEGQTAHQLAKDGALAGLSIGYRTIKDRFTEKARELIELGLHEVSLVSVPMNDKAVLTAVKEMVEAGGMPTVRQFEEFLRDAGGFSKTVAAAIAGTAAPHLRGEPDSEDAIVAAFWEAMRNAPIIDLTGAPD